ncbi:hypothetical protein GWI33_003125, partial [Rhynchophorus ferrugineus]
SLRLPPPNRKENSGEEKKKREERRGRAVVFVPHCSRPKPRTDKFPIKVRNVSPPRDTIVLA